MERDSVIAALRENIDKRVDLYFADGEVQTASIIVVDDEGVVYDLVGSNRESPNSPGQALWTTVRRDHGRAALGNWATGLTPSGETVLLMYEMPHFGH